MIEHDSAKGLRTDLVDRVRKILTTLILAEDMDGFLAGPRLVGMSINSPVTARVNGAFQHPAIGESRLKSRTAASIT